MKFVAGVLAAVAGVGTMILLVGGDAVRYSSACQELVGSGRHTSRFFGLLRDSSFRTSSRILATQLAVAAAGHSEHLLGITAGPGRDRDRHSNNTTADALATN